MKYSRRHFFNQLAATAMASLPLESLLAQSKPTFSSKAIDKARVVVVGGGFGGAATAKYLKKFSNGRLNVTLIDPTDRFVSCPMSNLVVSGQYQIADITKSRQALQTSYGIEIIRDHVERILPDQRQIVLKQGGTLSYDRLVLSPGVEMMWDSLPAMQNKALQDRYVHAMQAGPQTLVLRKQLESMQNGDVFAIYVPLAPYRCPPSPYERASQVADYFQKHLPRSKILILDANAEITSKPALFKKAWSTYYPNMIEYRNHHTLVDVDAAKNALMFEVQDDVSAQVLNIIPPMRAADIAFKTGLANINRRWCEVDFLSYESKVIPHIHLLGDAVQSATQTPKSAQVANGQAKICAQAIVNLLAEQAIPENPSFSSICYSILGHQTAAHISTEHEYDVRLKSMAVRANSGSISKSDTPEEYQKALNWANDIWRDTLA